MHRRTKLEFYEEFCTDQIVKSSMHSSKYILSNLNFMIVQKIEYLCRNKLDIENNFEFLLISILFPISLTINNLKFTNIEFLCSFLTETFYYQTLILLDV